MMKMNGSEPMMVEDFKPLSPPDRIKAMVRVPRQRPQKTVSRLPALGAEGSMP